VSHRILDKLERHDLYLKPEKCAFAQKCIEFLGVVLENVMAKIRVLLRWAATKSY